MALDPSKPLNQEKTPAGTLLFESGKPVSLLCLVHKGDVVAVDGAHGNRKLFTMGANSVPGFSCLVMKKDLPYQLVTATDCVISAFPVKSDGFSSMILGKLNVGITAVRSQLQQIITTYQLTKKYNQYLAYADRILDNASLFYARSNPNEVKNASDAEESVDPSLPGIKSVMEDFEKNGGEYPNPITHQWLENDHSGQLRKDYNRETSFDNDEFQFIKRILSLPVNIQGSVFKSDINILYGMSQRLSRLHLNNVEEMLQLQHEMGDVLETLVGKEYSLAEKLFLLADTLESGIIEVSEGEFHEGIKFFVEHSTKLLGGYRNYLGRDFQNRGEGLKKLKDFLERSGGSDTESAGGNSQEGGQTTVSADHDAIRQELSGSVAKIMKFAEMSNDDLKKMSEELKSLRNEDNPLDSTPELRKLRRQIGQTYWKTWENAYNKYRDAKGNVPTPVRLMLFYGFFDDEFLSIEHQVELYNISDISRPKPEYPVHHAVDWVDRVGSKEENPSIDEMGLTYFEKLKQEYKESWKRESDVPSEIDTGARRVHYEIETFIQSNVGLTSGSLQTAFPILTSNHIVLPLEKSFVSMKSISDALDHLLSTDYSAFHRETMFNDEEAGIMKEFIQEQVIPNFILVPSIGSKIMMWQDISGRSKSSRGRIAVPIFATADLFTMILDAVGAFRWELTKTIQGADWNNVAIPSITADYTDYVQFYKKNRDLSPEIKEKLSAEFKRFRTDRDRFVNDYTSWVKYESEGVLKLNKVARSIFYRHIPFAKEIRENLASQPAYSELNNRLTNIRKKKLKELEVRYRKFGDNPPPRLRENMEFYKV